MSILFVTISEIKLCLNQKTTHKTATKTKKDAAFGQLAVKLLGGGGGSGCLDIVCSRPVLVLGFALVHQTEVVRFMCKILCSYV